MTTPIIQDWSNKRAAGWRGPSSHGQIHWTGQSLTSTSHLSSITLGTGASIFKTIQPALEATEHELIFVTCFWAHSTSLDTFRGVLFKLSAKASTAGNKVRIRICFSSLSLFQKLFQTSSLNGQVYPPSTWSSKPGLPSAQELPGLDIEIKSIFVRPFSVMHPKFIIIDRQQVFLPSCNVSWEDWFEGCIELSGDITQQFLRFWQGFWANLEDRRLEWNEHAPSTKSPPITPTTPFGTTANLPVHITLSTTAIDTVFLPSPHHINPLFRPFPWQSASAAPATPLNDFLISLFATVKHALYIQTPNLTSPPVLQALLNTLKRGVDVHIVTSERLMILEQLVTGGTTTSRCVGKLVKKYKRLVQESDKRRVSQERLVEEGRESVLGRLMIEYYQPLHAAKKIGAQGGMTAAEPVQSHLKLTIADDEIVVLGSGNMDRASWYTSQELGVAFFSKQLASELQETMDVVLRDRKRVCFDSDTYS